MYNLGLIYVDSNFFSNNNGYLDGIFSFINLLDCNLNDASV
jgi:hypothetical protein